MRHSPRDSGARLRFLTEKSPRIRYIVAYQLGLSASRLIGKYIHRKTCRKSALQMCGWGWVGEGWGTSFISELISNEILVSAPDAGFS